MLHPLFLSFPALYPSLQSLLSIYPILLLPRYPTFVQMSYPLSVSSFPDTISTHEQPLNVEVQIVVTPASTKKPCPIHGAIKNLFTKDHVPLDVSPEFPRRNSESSVEPWNPVPSDNPARLSHQTNDDLFTVMPTNDGTSYHNTHHGSWSQATSQGQCSPWTDVLVHHQPPRSTKESIASLGLSQRSPLPDCLGCTDFDPMVTLCCRRIWVETPSLPPLPPLPPKESPMEIPVRPSSSLSHTSNICNEIEIENEIEEDADRNSEPSPPPSPLVFSNRTSSYIAAEGAKGQTSVEVVSNTMRSTSSSLSANGQLKLPTSPPRRRTAPPTTMPVEAMAHLRVFPVYPSSIFASKPKPQKLKTPTTPSPSSPSASSSSPKRTGWKRFYRRHSVSDIENTASPSVARSQTPVGPVASSETLSPTLGRTSSISQSDYSEHTIAEHPVEPAPQSQSHGNINDVPHIVARAHVGGVWQEKEVGEVISTLRTMKVSGRITPKFKG
ncbi:unnamed protein product [Somion occarium]|uniref:Uncharacterized protein n=1 Tax=Somion occarium TaxID=3059160 RepID=A0ABP1DN36_9APHY